MINYSGETMKFYLALSWPSKGWIRMDIFNTSLSKRKISLHQKNKMEQETKSSSSSSSSQFSNSLPCSIGSMLT